MNYILCADLHLKETEKEYSFSVLSEIIDICIEKKCQALLLAGDVFDSREDLKKLRTDFRSVIEKLPDSCTVYFLPGNHEELRAPSSESLDSFAFGGKVNLLNKKPYSLCSLNAETELLAIPFQQEYSEYRRWEVPLKNKPMRILLAHGTVNGIVYTGPGEETNSILGEDLFSFLQADIAAMGHIHKHIQKKEGNTFIYYPGSARVWREGEEGKHCVLFGNTKNTHLEPLYLDSAGEYRVVSLFASPSGEIRPEISEIKPKKNDWLHLELHGVVENEPDILSALEKIKKQLEKQCRKVTSSEKLSVLSGISTHPLAVRFLRAWEEKASDFANEAPSVYEAARLQGLLALKNVLERQK